VWLARLLARLRRPDVPGAADPLDVPVEDGEQAEMTARFDAVALQYESDRDRLVRSRLAPVVSRRIPVRVIEPLADRGATRVRFADGTAVTVRGEMAGDAGVLAAAVRGQGVVLGSCTTRADGTHVVFDWSGGRRHISMRVTGLDQPD
jgi:hypothetical protein